MYVLHTAINFTNLINFVIKNNEIEFIINAINVIY